MLLVFRVVWLVSLISLMSVSVVVVGVDELDQVPTAPSWTPPATTTTATAPTATTTATTPTTTTTDTTPTTPTTTTTTDTNTDVITSASASVTSASTRSASTRSASTRSARSASTSPLTHKSTTVMHTSSSYIHPTSPIVSVAGVMSFPSQCQAEQSTSPAFSEQQEPDSDFEGYVCPQLLEKRRKVQVAHQDCQRNSTAKMLRLRSMVAFVKFLESHRLTVLYVGDSLQLQMYNAFLCAVEAENPLLLPIASERVLYHPAHFLTHLPDGCILRRENKNATVLQSEAWYTKAIDAHVTHVVINTGAWWNPAFIFVDGGSKEGLNGIRSASQEETTSCFQRHFGPNSRLFHLLQNLKKKHHIVPIWRDLAPAGICDTTHQSLAITENYMNYVELFPVYNALSQKLITSPHLGGLVVPHVWEYSLPHWREHRASIDVVHWCMFTKYNIPSLWNTLLFELMFWKYHQKGQNHSESFIH